MAYSIVENTATSFIENRSIRLPRFQRKQTWKAEDNFKLCISVFKGYPIGVVIINSTQQPESIDWLLDGRQRRNALIEMRNNPVSVYMWAQKFVKFKNNDNPQQLTDKFFSSINDYLQNDYDNSASKKSDNNDDESYDCDDESDNSDDYFDEQSSFVFAQQLSSLQSLCDLISIVHPIKNKESNLERMFLFNDIISVQDLDYSVCKNGEYVIDVPKLWSFVKVCANDGYDTKDAFVAYLIKRYKLSDDSSRKIRLYVEQHWEYYDKCMKTLLRCEETLQKSTVGIIKLTNASPLDAQNIFSLVNNGGTKLVSEELLSARPFWNAVVENPSFTARDKVKVLYDRLGIIAPQDVYRWDLCASLLLQIDYNNLIFNNMPLSCDRKSESNFKNTLSLGFKLTSAILVGGINNTSVTKLEKKSSFDWNIGISNLVTEINMVISILEDFEYFKYLKAWNQTIMSLTSNTIAIEFLTIMYKRWKETYNCPSKSSAAVKQFAKEAFVLYDRLVYEYSIRVWSGSSDNKLASDIKNIQSRITEVSSTEWISLIRELATGSYKGKATKVALLKPLVYHYFCIKRMTPTLLDLNTTYEIDHIVAQNLFSNVSDETISSQKDCILNLALLPKGDNIAKSDQKLNLIKVNDPWLSEQIKKYAEITDDDMDMLSDISNVNELKKRRLPLLLDAFTTIRTSWIMN